MNKGDLTSSNDNKAPTRKGKSLLEVNAYYFSNLAENSKFTFYCQKLVFALCDLRMEWWLIKLHSLSLSNNAELFNLIQIFPLLQLAPVTFLPSLPYPP